MSRASRPPPASFPVKLSFFWQLQFAGWGAFAVLSLPLKQLAFGSLGSAALLTAYQLPLSLALSAALRRFYQRTQPARRSFARATLIVWVACAAVCAVDTGVSIALARLLDISTQSDLVEPALYFFRFAVYLGWSLAYFLIRAQLSAREQAFQAAVAEERHRFEILRYQLNPGFLTQSLSAIAQEMTQNVAAAHAMTRQLADYCQSALRPTAQKRPTTIGDEVALLRTYLELERLRQHDALLARFDIDESLLELPLPPVLLLPLAERAAKSGHGTAEEPLEITIAIQRSPEGLVLIEVAHTRQPPGTRPPFPAATPMDAADVRASLERHFSGRYRFGVSRDSLKERTTLCLPLGA